QMNEKTLIDFDWVNARAKCSLSSMFVELQMDAEKDVERINELKVKTGIGPLFELKKAEGNFTVIRLATAETQSPTMIAFRLNPESIMIESNRRHADRIAVTVALNNQGQCVLKLDDEELYRWQLLKRVLEKLFFTNT